MNLNLSLSTKINEDSFDKRSNSFEFKKPANPLYANRNSVVETIKTNQKNVNLDFLDKITCSIRNKDTGEILNLQDADRQLNLNLKSDIYAKLKRRQHLIWQDWWAQKRIINHQFLEAVKKSNYKLCLECLDSSKRDLKADINFRDEKKNSPLHYACDSGNYDIVLLILKNEADLEIKNSHNQSPLLIAASKFHN